MQNVESIVDREKQHHQVITSVAHRYHRTQFTIHHEPRLMDDLLGSIATAGISIDLINIFPNSKVFTIDQEDEKALQALLEKQGYSYEILPNCAKVTVIGERMTGVPGVMARIVRALNREQIDIYQTADSLTTIACLIQEQHVAKAIDVLHDEFHL